jgi:hypothetical protein
VPNPDVLAVRVANEQRSRPDRGTARDLLHRAALQRVPRCSCASPIEPDELEELLVDAWRVQAPKALRSFDEAHQPG